MEPVHVREVLGAPIDKAWKLIRDFADIRAWETEFEADVASTSDLRDRIGKHYRSTFIGKLRQTLVNA